MFAQNEVLTTPIRTGGTGVVIDTRYAQLPPYGWETAVLISGRRSFVRAANNFESARSTHTEAFRLVVRSHGNLKKLHEALDEHHFY